MTSHAGFSLFITFLLLYFIVFQGTLRAALGATLLMEEEGNPIHTSLGESPFELNEV